MQAVFWRLSKQDDGGDVGCSVLFFVMDVLHGLFNVDSIA